MDFSIKISGARQNNLKSLNLEIPLERLVCITGPSGSGKSSLAFDTLYAEGHRRYVESLNTYARQFFERLPKPEIDSIENICPSIALQQKNPIKNSRSTVGTSTEVYDYLRLLFAKLGKAFCPNGHGEIKNDSPQSAAEETLAYAKDGSRAYVGFALKEEVPAESMIEKAFLRYFDPAHKNEIKDLEELRGKKLKKNTHIVVDRLILTSEDKFRLIESLEASFRQSGGFAFVYILDSNEILNFNSLAACSRCGIEVPRRSPLLFSFNSPLGACPNCRGFGNILDYDESLIIPQPKLSLEKGAVDPFTKKIMQNAKRKLFDFAKQESIPLNVPFSDLSAEQRKLLLHGKGKYRGIFGSLRKLEEKKYKLHVRVFLRRYQSSFECLTCHGSRLRPESLWIKLNKCSIYDLSKRSLRELEIWFENFSSELSESDQILSGEILRQIRARLHFLNRMGLHYLSLHRLSKTLSGGESQRINLANQLGAELSGTLYVLDEPSIGLHAIDRDRLLDSLGELVERGNSVVVVEHDLDTIRKAEQIIELGPESGKAGGQLVFQGTQEEFRKSNSLTARYLRGDLKIEIPKKRRKPGDQWLSVQGASENNLRNVSLNLPLNLLVGVSGVSGSGKSTLIQQTLYNALARVFYQSTEPIGRFKKIFGVDQINGVVLLDQSPIGKSSRSIPLSVIGGFDEVRWAFSQTAEARRRHYTPSHFSFNVPGGRCETCKGEGFVKTEMYFLDDLYLICEDCDGKRYKKETLQIKLNGKNIHDVLQMTVSEARAFFSSSKNLLPKLQILEKVGLGYIQLGQSSHSLSGGESQRLKIASEISSTNKKNLIYILDEPTTGLHVSEISLLLNLLNDLVDAGNTVVVIEHHLDILKSVDWLIDLGPGAGEEGGKIVGEGAPEKVSKLNTPTGLALKKII